MVKDWNKSLRPRQFSDIKGLTKIIQTFRYLLAADSFPHTALFYGPSGVGKSCVAEICAKALVCTGATNDTDLPCNQCASCKKFNEGHSTNIKKYNMPDLKTKEEIDEVLNEIFHTAGMGRRVFILEEVQGMDQKTAQDRFLEDLTRVPDDVYIIMCTTQVHALSSTFRNRTTEYYFPTPTDADCIELIRNIGKKNNLILPDDNLLRVFVRANKNTPRKIIACLENFANVSDFFGEAINDFFDLESRTYYEELFCALIDKDVSVFDFVKKLKQNKGAQVSKIFEGLRDLVTDVVMEISLGEYCGVNKDALDKIKNLLMNNESILYEIAECLTGVKDIEMCSDNTAFFHMMHLKLKINNITLRSAIKNNAAQASVQSMSALSAHLGSKSVLNQNSEGTKKSKTELGLTNKMVQSASDLQSVLGDVPIVR